MPKVFLLRSILWLPSRIECAFGHSCSFETKMVGLLGEAKQIFGFLWGLTLRFTNVRRLGSIFGKRLLEAFLLFSILPNTASAKDLFIGYKLRD